MKRISRNILAAILATAGILLIFCIPITNYMITSFHPKVEQQKSYNVPYNWDDVKLINLFSVIKARVDHPEIHVIGAIYNEKIKLNTPVAEGVNNTIFSLCASTLYPNEKMGKGNYIIAAHNVRRRYLVLFIITLTLAVKLTLLILIQITLTKLLLEKLRLPKIIRHYLQRNKLHLHL